MFCTTLAPIGYQQVKSERPNTRFSRRQVVTVPQRPIPFWRELCR